MKNVYIGKNLEEALSNAEKDLGKLREELIYEIDEGKKSFFRGKEIRILVKGYKTTGKIGIKNEIFNYIEGDNLPEIEPGQNVIVKLNGRIIGGKTKVKKSDIIEVETPKLKSERNMHITVSKDKMEAAISVEYTPERTYKVLDKEENSLILIEAELISETYPEKFTKSDVEKIINESKIKYGVKWEEIDNVINGGTFVIARGQEPERPIDDKVRYFFNTEKQCKPVEIDGKVDYYNLGLIEYVERGKVLAVKEDGKNGKSGCDIYGEVIPGQERRKNKILVGPGCEVLDNGSKVVASIEGLPSIKGERICVFPAYIINGDVNIATGNVKFDGDVVIKGNVKEGMKIKAGNNVTILGSVADSKIISGGDVNISKNIISTEVRAGDKEYIDIQAIDYLKLFSNFLADIYNAFEEVNKSGKINQKIGSGLIFKVLLQSKFNETKIKLNNGKMFFEKNNINIDILEVWKNIIGTLDIIENGGMNNPLLIKNIKNIIDNFVEQYNVLSTPANVTIGYSQNSNVFATNIVEVKGKGCYNTNIESGNKVIISGQPGVFRGGQVSAVKNIQMREVGSSAGVLTILKTSKEGIIEAKVIYQNTLIILGEQMHKFDYPVKNVKAYIDKGELIVEKLKL